LDEEAEEIASAANQLISDFASEIEDKAPYRYEMKKTGKDGKCVFLTRNRCIIYSKRPLICRFYPFGLTINEQKKTVYYTKECPGIGRGKTLRKDEFNKLLRQANKRNRVKRGKGEVER
jgi:Fe-S-cluster containining protein